MAATAAAHPPLESQNSFDSISRLVGELSSDGTASLRKEDSDFANGSHRAVLARALSDRPPSVASSTTNTSEEDYDVQKTDPAALVAGSKGGGLEVQGSISPGRLPRQDSRFEDLKPPSSDTGPGFRRRKSIPVTLEKTDKKGRYILTADDTELRQILRQGIERDAGGAIKKRRSRFSDLVFTRQFTTFDRQNPTSAASPFHGFFTLFWLGTALMLLKIVANNWRFHGSVFGKNEILQLMFYRDVLVLGISDGVLCGSTGICLLFQKVVYKGWLNWDRSGWIIQNVSVHHTPTPSIPFPYAEVPQIWQTFYLAAVVGWTLYREWSWTHTVFIVLHCIAMLMKQHSYSFYNGHRRSNPHLVIF
jgi:sterol O-acyltransferase